MAAKRLLAGLMFVVAIVAGHAEGAVVTLQPGPSGVKDTWIYDVEDYSHGDWGELRANQTSVHDQRILIEFTDLSAIPTGATINSASLELYKYDEYSSASVTLDARRITSAWAESVTYSTQPTVGATVEDSTTVSGLINQWFSWDLTSLVQDWMDGVVPNYGVTIYDHGSGLYMRFVSSDNQTATQPSWAMAPTSATLQPKLTIDYTSAVPEPTTLAIWSAFGALGLIAARRRRK